MALVAGSCFTIKNTVCRHSAVSGWPAAEQIHRPLQGTAWRADDFAGLECLVREINYFRDNWSLGRQTPTDIKPLQQPTLSNDITGIERAVFIGLQKVQMRPVVLSSENGIIPHRPYKSS